MTSAARRCISFTGALIASGLVSHAASAAEQVVQIDSLAPGDSANVCPCFVAGEEAAVWLTSPCDGSIVALQVFWRSQFGGQQVTIEDSIIVYEGGTYPNPGPVKEELLAPVMTDGVLNEYRFEDQNQTIPIDIPVTANEEFAVSFVFFNQNSGDLFAPSIVYDTDGITPNKNAIRAQPGGWIRSEDVGVTGDWVIRVVIDCAAGDPIGSCCLPDGSCADGLTATQCAAASGAFQGALTNCSTLNPPCPQPLGACCFSGGGCLQLTDVDCGTASGSWLGANTDCTDCACDGDANGDNTVDVNDISYVLFRLGDPCPAPGCPGDANGDGTVDVNDISYVLFRLGNPC
jgi:hypothetical protein